MRGFCRVTTTNTWPFKDRNLYVKLLVSTVRTSSLLTSTHGRVSARSWGRSPRCHRVGSRQAIGGISFLDAILAPGIVWFRPGESLRSWRRVPTREEPFPDVWCGGYSAYVVPQRAYLTTSQGASQTEPHDAFNRISDAKHVKEKCLFFSGL